MSPPRGLRRCAVIALRNAVSDSWTDSLRGVLVLGALCSQGASRYAICATCRASEIGFAFVQGFLATYGEGRPLTIGHWLAALPWAAAEAKRPGGAFPEGAHTDFARTATTAIEASQTQRLLRAHRFMT